MKMKVDIPTLTIPIETAVTKLTEGVKLARKKKEQESCNKQIQTIYRESSAQTSPWEPDYKVVDGSDPEILKLNFLKWGNATVFKRKPGKISFLFESR